MKKQILLTVLLVICLLAGSSAQAPTWLWAKLIGGTGSFGRSITVDPSGNVYISGSFISSVDFDPGPGTYTLTSAGSSDIFICKYTSAGEIVWAKRMGGTLNDGGTVVKFDPLGSGSVVVSGWFDGTCDLDPGAGTLNFTSFGGKDIFITKMDTDGNLTWSKQIGGTSNADYVNAMTIDGSGNVIYSGYFLGTADFDPGPNAHNLSTVGWSDIFMAKLNASGNFSFAYCIGGIGNDAIVGLTSDASGNI